VISFPKPRPKVLEKRDLQREAERQKRDAYAAVDLRDGRRCRCCGQSADPRAMSALQRGHRHHLIFMSRGGQDTLANLVLLCAVCHARVHCRELVIVGDNANKVLRFQRVK
jgi:5-methylcytosine-specific restriction endonuclease McrA